MEKNEEQSAVYEKLAEEIEKTRRRVSALENVRIPNLQDTIKFITMQLDERNRDAVVSTMRVKAMIVAISLEIVQLVGIPLALQFPSDEYGLRL